MAEVEAVVDDKDQDTIRKEAKAEIKRCVGHLLAIIRSAVEAVDDEDLTERTEKLVVGLQSSIETNLTILAKKPKRKPNEKNRHNLTKPCIVTKEFAAYVKDLRDTGKLGDMTKIDPKIKAAIGSVIVGKCSSLLVSTLLISCDNYNILDREATFAVTPTMKKHLSTALGQVTTDREKAHKEDDSKALFDENNYPSAMNNAIAARVRSGEYKGNMKEASDELALLQAYLKTHNAALRAKKAAKK
jgi:hypothetical protein